MDEPQVFTRLDEPANMKQRHLGQALLSGQITLRTMRVRWHSRQLSYNETPIVLARVIKEYLLGEHHPNAELNPGVSGKIAPWHLVMLSFSSDKPLLICCQCWDAEEVEGTNHYASFEGDNVEKSVISKNLISPIGQD